MRTFYKAKPFSIYANFKNEQLKEMAEIDLENFLMSWASKHNIHIAISTNIKFIKQIRKK